MKNITNEELLKEVRKLKQENSSLRKLYQKDTSELKQSKKELHESEERFRLLFKKAPLAYQSLDIDGNFIEVNQTWSDTLGYTHEEIIGKWFGDFLSHDYQDAFRERFQIFKAKGKIHSEFEMVHKTGNILFIAFEGKIVFDLNGEFKQTHCILQDITERKRSEDRLKKSEEILKFYTDNSPMAVVEWDSDFIVTKWTGESEKMFGWSAEETIGKPIMDLNLIFEADIPIVQNTMERLTNGLNKQVVSTNRNYRKDRSIITCEWYNTILAKQNGKMLSVLSQVLDITDRKQAEENLLESEEKYHLLFKNMNSGFQLSEAIVDENNIPVDFRYLDGNNQMKLFTGFSIEEVRGKTIKHLIPDLDINMIKRFGNVVLTGEEMKFEYFSPAFSKYFKICAYSPRKDLLAIIFDDITEQKLAEKALKESEMKLIKLNADKDRFIYILGHDLKNPFNAILGFTDLLRENIRNYEIDKIEDIVKIVNKSARILNNTAYPFRSSNRYTFAHES